MDRETTMKKLSWARLVAKAAVLVVVLAGAVLVAWAVLQGGGL